MKVELTIPLPVIPGIDRDIIIDASHDHGAIDDSGYAVSWEVVGSDTIALVEFRERVEGFLFCVFISRRVDLLQIRCWDF